MPTPYLRAAVLALACLAGQGARWARRWEMPDSGVASGAARRAGAAAG